MKADALNQEANEKEYTNAGEYEADQKEILSIYSQAVPYLEVAHEIMPQNPRSRTAAQDSLLSSARRTRHDGEIREIQRALQNRCNSNVGFQIKPRSKTLRAFCFSTDHFVYRHVCSLYRNGGSGAKRKVPYNLFVTVEKFIAVRCMQ